MLTVLNCLTTAHDYRFVGAALAICILGCIISTRQLAQAREARRAKHAVFVIMAGVTAGLTIWSTHFLAMLGFMPDMPHGFRLEQTVLSLAFAIITSLAGFCLAAQDKRGITIETGGLILGLGIALMHFMGMNGFVVQGVLDYDPALFVASIVLGGALGVLAANRVGRPVTRYCRLGGAAALTLAIGAMHFTAMGAVQIVPDPRVIVPVQLLPDAVLGALVFIVAIMVIGLGAATYLAESQTRRDSVAHYRHLAMHDFLTGLPNRAAAREELPRRLKAASAGQVAIIAIDLNRFKEINDVYGHAAGDAVLSQTSRRMQEALEAGEFFARIGGDEFIAAKPFALPNEIEEFAARIAHAFSRPNELGNARFTTSASIGIAVSPTDGATMDDLTQRADLAMYRSKKLQTGEWCWYDADADEDGMRRGRIANGLRSAIERQELRLTFQPQIAVSRRELLGFEALLRWKNDKLGEVGPAEFIPVAEQTGIIVEIGEWVLREACREALRWPSHLSIAVNVSPVQILRPGFMQRLHEILLETGFSPARLELEITETMLIENPGHALHVLRQIKAMGVRIAMDDFGTGYSSLSTVFSFPFDKIKVDRSFLCALDNQPQARAVIETVIELGHKLAIPVLAEGVETKDQAAFLDDRACDEAQGYLFGRPLDARGAFDLALNGLDIEPRPQPLKLIA